MLPTQILARRRCQRRLLILERLKLFCGLLVRDSRLLREHGQPLVLLLFVCDRLTYRLPLRNDLLHHVAHVGGHV